MLIFFGSIRQVLAAPPWVRIEKNAISAEGRTTMMFMNRAVGQQVHLFRPEEKRFALYIALFTVAGLLWSTTQPFWQHSTLLPSGKFWASTRVVDDFSAKLYDDSVRRYANEGDRDIGGFMVAFEKEVHIAAVEYIDGAKGLRKIYPYVSNFNLQYAIGKLLSLGRPELSSFAIVAFSVFCGAGMAIVVAALGLFAEKEFGRKSGYAVACVFCLSPMMVARALNPYWVMFLAFLPFLAVLLLYPKTKTDRQFLVLAILTAALVGLKALTGYEYLSSIVLGAALPIFYYEFKAEGRVDGKFLWRTVSRGLIVGALAAIAFACAASLHVLKAAIFFGSLEKGVEAFTVPFSYSTGGSASGIRGTFHIGGAALILATINTLIVKNWIITFPLYGGLILTSLLLFVQCRCSPAKLWRALGPAGRALSVTLLLSAVASLSWIALVPIHSLSQPHVNWILGYMFLQVFAAMQLGVNVSLIARNRLPIEDGASTGSSSKNASE
jgi:hypothetical protein